MSARAAAIPSRAQVNVAQDFNITYFPAYKVRSIAACSSRARGSTDALDRWRRRHRRRREISHRVSYASPAQVVENKKAFGGPLTYVLYQCGMDAPDASLFPAGALFFAIPLRAVAVEDAAALAFMV